MEQDPLALLDHTDAALEPLLEVTKDSVTNISTLRAVLMKILSHPDIFCGYDQVKQLLLENPNNSNNNKMDDAQVLATLDLFSYGTYRDYSSNVTTNNTTTYLTLNDTQLFKLRQLTVLSCAQDACTRGDSTLTYAALSEALELPLSDNGNQRSMEHVIISCLYARVLNGKLCQKTRQLVLTSVPPCRARDVPLSHISSLLQSLQGLEQRLTKSHDDLETAHTQVSSSLVQTAQYWKQVQERQAKAQAQVTSGGGNNNNAGTVRSLAGWPEHSGHGSVGARRSSASRQSKRSRGGLGGSFTTTEPFRL